MQSDCGFFSKVTEKRQMTHAAFVGAFHGAASSLSLTENHSATFLSHEGQYKVPSVPQPKH